MGIAERIYELVKDLPEAVASEILDFAVRRRARAVDKEAEKRRHAAFATFDKYAGRVERLKLNRESLHDRPGLR